MESPQKCWETAVEEELLLLGTAVHLNCITALSSIPVFNNDLPLSFRAKCLSSSKHIGNEPVGGSTSTRAIIYVEGMDDPGDFVLIT